jgi:hypothetical protein
MNPPTITTLTQLALDHWLSFCPEMAKSLRRAGELHTHAHRAAQQTLLELTSLTALGLRPEEAWEIVRDRYLLLPAETPPTPSTSDLTPIFQELAEIYRSLEDF